MQRGKLRNGEYRHRCMQERAHGQTHTGTHALKGRHKLKMVQRCVCSQSAETQINAFAGAQREAVSLSEAHTHGSEDTPKGSSIPYRSHPDQSNAGEPPRQAERVFCV